MALVDKVLIPHLLQSPPFGLDVVVVICNIRIVHVSPEAYTVTHVLPLVLICPDGFLTLLDEGLYAVAFDLGLAVDTQSLLDFKLYRKSVCIPASLEDDGLALHSVISRDNVLNDSGLNMSDMRLAVSCRRPVIKSKSRSTVCLGSNALLVNVVVLPEFENLFLSVYEIEVF